MCGGGMCLQPSEPRESKQERKSKSELFMQMMKYDIEEVEWSWQFQYKIFSLVKWMCFYDCGEKVSCPGNTFI